MCICYTTLNYALLLLLIIVYEHKHHRFQWEHVVKFLKIHKNTFSEIEGTIFHRKTFWRNYATDTNYDFQ